MARSLLDANVWVALFDDAHVFSAEANALIQRPRVKSATCPLVENSVVRVLNLPSYGRRGPIGLARVRVQLQRTCSELDHAFWPGDASLRDDTQFNFGRAITLDAVRGAKAQHLTIL